MTKLISFLLFTLVACGLAWAESLPNYFAASPGALAEAKTRLAAHDPALQPAFDALVSAADRALQATPPTVTERTKPHPAATSMIT